MPPVKKQHPPRTSRDRFDAVFRLAPIGLAILDLDGKPRAVNPALCRALGYTEAELAGRDPAELSTPELAAATAELRARVLDPASGGAGVIEKCYRHKQGHLVWGIVNLHLHRDASGAPDFFVAHVQDVTERRLAEAALRESEAKFRIAFENAPLGMGIVGATGRFVDVNPALCQMVGYARDELLAITFNDITHPDDVERGNRWLRRLLAGDFAEPELEKRYVHKAGHLIWGLVRARWVKSADGAERMAIVHVMDITSRKRAEEALRERECQLREAHVIARMGHWHLDLASGAVSWTEGMFRLLELDPATTVPAQELVLSRLHPDDAEAANATFSSALEEGLATDRLYRLLRGDGRVMHVRGICQPELDGAGRTVAMSGILQDITSIKEAEERRAQLEEQLQRARRMEAIGYLAGGVAHDFNNLLTVIGGNASLARLDAGRDSQIAPLLSEITQAVSSAADLTRQLLAFSRRQVIEPKVMNLNDRIASLSSMLRRLLGEHLELVTILDPDLGLVRFDVSQAEQILINLSVNARDAMASGGKLTLRTANVELGERNRPDRGGPSGPFVLLEVSDTGTGMSEETQQHLFEPFFTTKEPGHGTGLGLAMVYGAIEQNHGHIEVSSKLGRGSTFRIYLPRLPAAEMTTADAPEPLALAPDGKTVFFVEDEPAVRDLGERVLARQGYHVRAFAGGREALAAARAEAGALDLVVTDVIMPGMNGRALADELRRLNPSLKVLFTSGYTQDVIAPHGVLEEGVQFLPKPYSFDELARKVREVLSHEAAPPASSPSGKGS